MVILIFVTLLTIAAIYGIFLAAFVRLWKNPPEIRMDVHVPPSVFIRLQHEPATVETQKPTEEPIPTEIMEYISAESELSGQDARKRRVRELYRDTDSWDSAFRLLQMEDQI